MRVRPPMLVQAGSQSRTTSAHFESVQGESTHSQACKSGSNIADCGANLTDRSRKQNRGSPSFLVFDPAGARTVGCPFARLSFAYLLHPACIREATIGKLLGKLLEFRRFSHLALIKSASRCASFSDPAPSTTPLIFLTGQRLKDFLSWYESQSQGLSTPGSA
jgi:hypothetical protein